MAQINRGQFERWAARFLDVKGPGTLTFVENSLFGVIPLDRRAPIEMWSLQGLYPYMAGQEVGAVVGDFGGMQIYNPADSGELVVIEKVWFNSDTSASYRILERGVTTTMFDASSSDLVMQSRDLRNSQNPYRGFYGVSNSSAPGGWTQIGRVRRIGDRVNEMEPSYVVVPGRSFGILAQSANISFTFTVWITIRRMIPSEQS